MFIRALEISAIFATAIWIEYSYLIAIIIIKRCIFNSNEHK